VQRKKCCHADGTTGTTENHNLPEAKFWLEHHPDGERCKMCPSCLGFPAMNKLQKICCHPSLIQARFDPNNPPNGVSKDVLNKARKEVSEP